MDTGKQSDGIERFRDIDAYTIADAARLHGVGGTIQKLKPQTSATRFVGRALTARIEFHPNMEVPLSQYGAAALLDRVCSGDVVVLDGGGKFLSALGDLAIAIILLRRGIAAVVNAAVRDVENIDDYFPLFALGVAIRSIASHGTVTAIGEPIYIDGIRIETGDLVAGCQGGIVAVPWSDRAGMLQKALNLLESDRNVREGLARGESMSGLWQQYKQTPK